MGASGFNSYYDLNNDTSAGSGAVLAVCNRATGMVSHIWDRNHDALKYPLAADGATPYGRFSTNLVGFTPITTPASGTTSCRNPNILQFDANGNPYVCNASGQLKTVTLANP